MLEFNCITQFVACYADWYIKVAVKFVVRPHDILIYTLRKWEQFSLSFARDE